MSVTMLQKPRHFDDLLMAVGPQDADGRVTFTAPCGCAAHRRRVLDGPLAGHLYGDGLYEVCDSHCVACEVCGRQTWPHQDCACG